MVKLILAFVFTGSLSFAATVEEQRKYNFDSNHPFVNKTLEIGTFTFYPHSVYKTDDIYFDSEDGDIRKNSISFRLRRVQKKIGKFEYAVQLKSEMTVAGEVRTELEFKDFSLQNVSGKSITTLIDDYIDKPESRKATADLFASWFERKKLSSLAPFQKLRDLRVEPKKLRPATLGRSERQRYHVYTDRTKKFAVERKLKNSKKNEFKVPDYFKENTNLIWLMEASFDTSHFYNLTDRGPRDIELRELEIENKYRPRKIGTHLMGVLEKTLIETKNAKTGLASKYLQAISYFLKE